MTTDNRAKLVRLLLPLLAVLVGIVLTSVAFLLAGYASAACHCSRPIAVAFPYAAMVWGVSRFESLGGLFMAFQYPAYALMVALGRSRKTRARIALIVFGVHVVAVAIGLLVYKA
jgi:hypothetical protein